MVEMDYCRINMMRSTITVNSEIFARVSFSRNFAYREIKSSLHGEITLSFTDIGKSCPNGSAVTQW